MKIMRQRRMKAITSVQTSRCLRVAGAGWRPDDAKNRRMGRPASRRARHPEISSAKARRWARLRFAHPNGGVHALSAHGRFLNARCNSCPEVADRAIRPAASAPSKAD